MAKKSGKTVAVQDAAPSFEEELAHLETIVRQLEEGQLGLGDSLQRYEQGVTHLKRCYQLLAQAQQRIELLLDVDSEGNERTEPFSEQAMSLEEKAGRRSRRRSRKTPAEGGQPFGGSGDMDAKGELF